MGQEIRAGRVWFSPVGTPMFNAFDDQGNPVTLTEDGVTPWIPLPFKGIGYITEEEA